MNQHLKKAKGALTAASGLDIEETNDTTVGRLTLRDELLRAAEVQAQIAQAEAMLAVSVSLKSIALSLNSVIGHYYGDPSREAFVRVSEIGD